MPKPSEILHENRARILRIIAAHHGQNPRVFGSVRHGTDTSRSDVDILVDVPPGTGLLTLGSMQYALEQSLGVPVDVLTPGDLPPQFRDSVLLDAAPL